MQRLLTDEEVADARTMINWAFWAPPALFTIACIAVAVLLIGADEVAWAIFAAFAIFTAILWFFRIRSYQAIVTEIDRRVAEVIEGTPEKVWMERRGIWNVRSGMCYVRVQGKNIRIPSDRYSELKDANSVKIAFLPATLIAVHIDVARGIGLA